VAEKRRSKKTIARLDPACDLRDFDSRQKKRPPAHAGKTCYHALTLGSVPASLLRQASSARGQNSGIVRTYTSAKIPRGYHCARRPRSSKTRFARATALWQLEPAKPRGASAPRATAQGASLRVTPAVALEICAQRDRNVLCKGQDTHAKTWHLRKFNDLRREPGVFGKSSLFLSRPHAEPANKA
jgi:hypothetical protein